LLVSPRYSYLNYLFDLYTCSLAVVDSGQNRRAPNKTFIIGQEEGDFMPETSISPEKIISLAPALTEILFALELSHRVAGVTDSCDYPVQVNNWPHVACWFDPDLEKLYALKPDLVLGLETAHRRLKLKLESKGIRVILVNPITVDEAINAMARIGDLLGVHEKAETLVTDLRNRLSALDARVSAIPKEYSITAARILDMEDNRFHVAGPLSFQYDIITQAGM